MTAFFLPLAGFEVFAGVADLAGFAELPGVADLPGDSDLAGVSVLAGESGDFVEALSWAAAKKDVERTANANALSSRFRLTQGLYDNVSCSARKLDPPGSTGTSASGFDCR